MTVSVDSFTLKTKMLTDEPVIIASDFPKWVNNQATKKHMVYGAKGVWVFSLYEHGVDYASSAAKYLRDMAKSGGTVTISASEGARFSLNSTVCYVTKVTSTFPLTGTENIRYFTVTFREV